MLKRAGGGVRTPCLRSPHKPRPVLEFLIHTACLSLKKQREARKDEGAYPTVTDTYKMYTWWSWCWLSSRQRSVDAYGETSLSQRQRPSGVGERKWRRGWQTKGDRKRSRCCRTFPSLRTSLRLCNFRLRLSCHSYSEKMAIL